MRQASSATGEAAKATGKIDWKKVAAWSGAAVALGAAAKFVKDSASATQDLAKQTMALQRATDMDTRTASAWVEVLKSRGIETATFVKSLTILSKQMTAAADGSDKAVALFKSLGVSMEDVRKGNV